MPDARSEPEDPFSERARGDMCRDRFVTAREAVDDGRIDRVIATHGFRRPPTGVERSTDGNPNGTTTVVCAAMTLHLATPRTKQAPLVLCCGDPDRVRHVAQDLLENAEVVTETRGLVGVTGVVDGVRVTVQATGMGGGSTAIVVHELIELGARVIIRAGTTGGLSRDVDAGDIVIATSVVADDGAGLVLAGPDPSPADPAVVGALRAAATDGERRVHEGAIVSTDLFYDPVPGRNAAWEARGLLSVEMEAAVVNALAARARIRAGSVLAVSNTLTGTDPGWLGARDRHAAGMDACRIGLAALARLA